MTRFYFFILLFFFNRVLYSQVVNDRDSLAVELNEVIVKAAWVKHSVDLDEYIVTNEMREKGITALELLDNVHGLRLDRITNKIVINNKNNVLLIVNGKECAYDYIKSINPENITRVKIIRNPKGRYLSEGYDAVIDLSVRYYDGIEMIGSNFLIINPTKNNGNKHIMMEQPMVSFTYTKNKLTFWGDYVYGISKWNTTIDKSFRCGDRTNNNCLRLSSIDGMEKYKYYGNSANVGINYRLSPKHEISVEFDYKHENVYLANNESYKINFFNNKNKINNGTFLGNMSNFTCTPSYTGSIFYLGHINDNIDIYSDISYNNLNNKVSNNFKGYAENSSFDFLENRHVLKHTTDVNFTINEKVSLKLGYFFNWKKFGKKDNDLDYSSSRYRIWNYFSYRPMDNLSFEIGAGEELEDIFYDGTHKTYFRLLPSLQVNYIPISNLNINLSYVSDGMYPSLSNINSVKTRVNPIASQKGNPSLKSAIEHKVTLEFTLFDRFTFSPSYSCSHNAITQLVQYTHPLFEFSYFNTDIQQVSFPINIEQPLGKYFNIKAGVEYYHSYGEYKSDNNKINSWLYNVNLSYFNKGYLLEFGYNRSLSKQNIIQGFSESGFDSWVLTFNKQWFDGKFSTMFTWCMPLKCGVNKYKDTFIKTSNYQERVSQNLKSYKNAILIHFMYRFNVGKSKTNKSHTNFDLEKRIFGGFGS